MFLTITATSADPEAAPATDLGFLLHKHPDRVQSFDLPVGTAHVYYPEATSQRCTAALQLDVDPIGLVRNRRFAATGFALAEYVNDRPYAASSLLAVAIGRVLGSALKGRCPTRPELEQRELDLTVHVPALPARGGGTDLVGRLFTPLGWQVDARSIPLDPAVPAWGDSRYVDLTLTGRTVLADALTHLYVLLPVLDGAKHYWVGPDEVDKLIRSSGVWLAAHPERELITRRYLAHRRSLITDVTERLAVLEDSQATAGGEVQLEADPAAYPDAVEEPATTPLAVRRKLAVVDALKRAGARRVVDLGCGEGALLRELVKDPYFTEILGVDVSARALDLAERRLHLDRMPDSQRQRIRLRQSSATYRDRELEAWDALVLMEVIEHVDLDRLPALERSVFAHARPASVVVTTPNVEYNELYESLAAGAMRHTDHRFEWTRAEFASWASAMEKTYGYAAELAPVGDVDSQRGAPTQLALFRRLT